MTEARGLTGNTLWTPDGEVDTRDGWERKGLTPTQVAAALFACQYSPWARHVWMPGDDENEKKCLYCQRHIPLDVLQLAKQVAYTAVTTTGEFDDESGAVPDGGGRPSVAVP